MTELSISGFTADWRKMRKTGALILAAVIGLYLPQAAHHALDVRSSAVSAGEQIDIWWPTEGAVVSGLQPFKVMLQNRAVEEYEMFWQVDDGQLVRMENNYEGYPHKEAPVDLSGWNWRGNGPYRITFTAKDQTGSVLGVRSVDISVNEPSSEPSTANTTEVATTTTDSVESPTSASVESGTTALNGGQIEIWWPTDGANLTGPQPLKALLKETALSEYDMYWRVDGGSANPMPDNYTDYPHKESLTDVSSWNWRSDGRYPISFQAVAKDGRFLAERVISVSVVSGATVAAPTTTVVAAESKPKGRRKDSPDPVSPTSDNVFRGAKLYVNPNSDAKRQADAWRSSRPEDARQVEKIAAGAETFWLGGWNWDIRGDVDRLTKEAQNQGALPVFVAYNIPGRDCGGYSAGGLNSPEDYRNWIRQIADALGGRKAAVILEPDALAQMDCLSSHDRGLRYNMIQDAVGILKGKGVAVYLDAAHPQWIPAGEMANRLKLAGLGQADGFAVNIANFRTDEENIRYGEEISRETGGKHFLVDTGRNGLGPSPDNQWCNPPGRALGRRPTTDTGHSLVDAILWVKGPGGSDGWCNGGPSAGTWFPEYALGLAQRAAY